MSKSPACPYCGARTVDIRTLQDPRPVFLCVGPENHQFEQFPTDDGDEEDQEPLVILP